jgi:TonB family protein
MPLRCLLFCSDQEATSLLVRVLAELQIDAEHCPNAATATERVTSQQFQIVILDWDDQPDAGLLLNTARTRKASERPLTLAIVGDDAGVPKALQAGANSILRTPLLVNQVRDTITTARDLLRAKLEQSVSAAKASAAKASAISLPAVEIPRAQTTLRAGEFLQSATPQPGAQFTTESDLDKRMLQSQPPTEIDPLQDLEPTAAALDTKDKAEETPTLPAVQPRGLAWYKARNAPAATGAAAAPALAPAPSPDYAPLPASGKTELLSFEQTPSYTATPVHTPSMPAPPPIEPILDTPVIRREQNDQKTESQLFAYMAGEHAEKSEPAQAQYEASPHRFRLAGVVLFVALIAAGAYWKLSSDGAKNTGAQPISTRMTSAVHAWLNPQPVTPAQAPASHENFARAGDEYKLPVAEAIPDATTDPSQIHVVPAVDPTAKQPNAAAANATQTTGVEAPPAANASDQPPVAAPDNASAAAAPGTASPSGPATQSIPPASTSAPPANTVPVQTSSTSAATKANVPPPPAPATQRNTQPQYTAVSVGIPSSLKSQMAANTSEAGGNKPPEAAMPSIEPVTLPEAAARNLLLQQPAPAYPESAKGQSGTVVLQVLIGRDGSVQDAKFLQGSLVFARAAIDAVKQWHFQPYAMNGRPVSTVTSLTVSFKP